MTIVEKQRVREYHNTRVIDKSLTRSKMMGWTTKSAQQTRFKTIASSFNFNNTSVLDLGCGDGDFKAYLDEKFSNFDYIGVDFQESFVNYAKDRFNRSDNTWFYNTDFTHCELPKVDAVVACGTLSYKSADLNYYIDCIEQFYNSSKRALIFNMLDEEFFESGPILVAHNKEQILSECKELCDSVTLKRGYLNNDFTIIMRKAD